VAKEIARVSGNVWDQRVELRMWNDMVRKKKRINTKEWKRKKRNGEEEREGKQNEVGRWIRKGTIEGSRKRKKEKQYKNK
jgi:hypothetical protein